MAQQHVFAVTLMADVAKATKDFRAASDQIAKLEDEVSKASKGSTALSNAIFGIGSSLIATASTAVAAGAVIERITIDADIALKAAGTSAMELNDAFLEASGSAGKLFKASRQLAGAGIEGAEAMKTMTQDARLLGQAMGTSTEDASVVMADFIRATGEKGPQAIKDWIATGVLLDKQGKLDIGTFKNLSHEILQSGINAGMTKESLLGMGVALQKGGIRGGEAATVMGSLVSRFKETMGEGSQLSTLLTEAGMSAQDFEKALPEEKLQMFMKGLGKFAQDPNVGLLGATKLLEGMNIAQGNTANKLVELAKRTGEYSNSQEHVNKLLTDSTDQSKMLADIEGSLSNQTGLLWEDFKDLAYTVGQVFVPFAKLLVGALRFVIDVFKNLSPQLQAVVVATGAVVGGWILMKKMMGGIIGSALKFVTHMGNVILAKMGDVTASQAVAAATGEQAAAQAALNKQYTATLVSQVRLIASKIKLWLATGSFTTATIANTAATQANVAIMGANTAATNANTVATNMSWAAALKQFAIRVKDNIVMAASTAGQWLLNAARMVGITTLVTTIATTIAGTAANMAMTVSLWATTAAAWAATLPLWAIVAVITAIIAIGLLFYQTFFGSSFLHISEGIGEVMPSVEGLGETFTGAFDSITSAASSFVDAISYAWTSVKNFFASIGSGIADAFKTSIDFIIDLISGLTDIIVWPFEALMTAIDSVTGMFTAIGQAITSLAAPFMPFINLLKDAIELAKGVADSLTGSSMFHIVENVREVNPALQKLHDSFAAIGKVAAKVSDSTNLPNEMRVKIEEPLSSRAAREMPIPPTSAPTGMPAAPAAAAAATTSPSAGPIRVVVPVSVELDGMVLARALTEQEVEIHNERHFNAPMHPLRGVEKG